MKRYAGYNLRMGGGNVSGKEAGYQSYLLRLWQDHCGTPLGARGEAPVGHMDDKAVWRASLESSLTGEKQRFSNLDSLFTFLRRQTSVVSEKGE